MEDVFDVPVSL